MTPREPKLLITWLRRWWESLVSKLLLTESIRIRGTQKPFQMWSVLFIFSLLLTIPFADSATVWYAAQWLDQCGAALSQDGDWKNGSNDLQITVRTSTMLCCVAWSNALHLCTRCYEGKHVFLFNQKCCIPIVFDIGITGTSWSHCQKGQSIL